MPVSKFTWLFIHSTILLNTYNVLEMHQNYIRISHKQGTTLVGVNQMCSQPWEGHSQKTDHAARWLSSKRHDVMHRYHLFPRPFTGCLGNAVQWTCLETWEQQRGERKWLDSYSPEKPRLDCNQGFWFTGQDLEKRLNVYSSLKKAIFTNASMLKLNWWSSADIQECTLNIYNPWLVFITQPKDRWDSTDILLMVRGCNKVEKVGQKSVHNYMKALCQSNSRVREGGK